MNHKKIFKKTSLLGLIGGSLIVGLPITTSETKAQTSFPNPCPGIYYKEPFNRVYASPEGCPPNEAAERRTNTAITTPATTPGSAVTPPLPEERSDAVAVVQPMDGQVSIMLKNNTNAVMTYEVVGQTGRRFLDGRTEVSLQNIPLPATITVVRQDEGLVKIAPMSPESGMLEIMLDEDTAFNDTQGVLRIQEDGQVFIN